MLKVYKDDKQIKFTYSAGECSDSFILDFSINKIDDNTMQLKTTDAINLFKWLFNHIFR